MQKEISLGHLQVIMAWRRRIDMACPPDPHYKPYQSVEDVWIEGSGAKFRGEMIRCAPAS
jgi:hypothetical protein